MRYEHCDHQIPTDGLEVTGESRILAADAAAGEGDRQASCAGAATPENKPFCDGALKREGFTRT